MNLCGPAPKAPGSFDRCAPLSETLARIPALRQRYGITRVANTTHLDRIGIPVYCAMVPKSPDILGVYNGKGVSDEAAIVSAVMEAAERQIGAAVTLAVREYRYEDVRRHLDLDGLGVPARRSGTVACVTGFDLHAQQEVPVPLGLVQCPWYGPPVARVASSNGLASGNTLLEAAFHAVCEVLERHVWSMNHIRSVLVPRFYGGQSAVDVAAAREVLLPAGDQRIDALVSQIVRCDLHLRAFMLHDDENLPPVALAYMWEPGSAMPMSHVGLGYGLSPVHALVRAITEAVQSRNVDIAGAREDMLRPDDPKTRTGEHTRRPSALPAGSWFFDGSAQQVALEDVADRSTGDLATDWRTLLTTMEHANFHPVLVDVTPPGESMHVVRALVPHAETVMFDNRVGQRGLRVFNPFGPRFGPGDKRGDQGIAR